MEIAFTNYKDLEHYERLHFRLKEILRWMTAYLSKSKAFKLTFTSIYRPYFDEVAKGRSGIHGFHRAADVVIIKQDGAPFSQVDMDRLSMLINHLFDYGDGGKHHVAVSAPHGTGLHLHLQARDETVHRRLADIKENAS